MRRFIPLVVSAVILALGCAPPPAGDDPGRGKEVLIEAPSARPLFSPAIRAGGLVFLSGKLGTRPGTRELATGGIQGETRQALENIRATLEEIDLAMTDLVKCTVFLSRMADYDAMNEVYVTFFPQDPPARSALAARGLALGAAVEIECIAAAR